MPQILRVVPEARLVIVGEGDQRESLKQQAGELKILDRVVFTGMRRDVPRLLTAFDLFCMPSYLEGLCNSVLEAFAMKLPVVATRAGGLPEIVRHEETGLLTLPHDPPLLAATIIRVLSDHALASSMGEAGHRLVHERFGVDRMVELTASLYASL